MESLDGRLFTLRRQRDGKLTAAVSQQGTWSWNAGTRYCADCLRDQPGVFKVVWRSPWSFACLEHKTLLYESCSSCHQQVAEMRGRNADIFDASRCRAHVGPVDATRQTLCRAPLSESPAQVPLDVHGAPFRAQSAIYQAVKSNGAAQLLRILQAISTALRGAQNFDLMATLSGLELSELRGLFDEEKRVGVSAPTTAYAMAGLVGAAFALDQLDEDEAGPLIRHLTFTRAPASVPRGQGYGPGSPSELLIRWPQAPAQLRDKILRAHDQDFTNSQRILGCTSVNPATLLHHRPIPGEVRVRFLTVPAALWPAWCSRFDVGGPVDGSTLATALAHALRACGTAKIQRDPQAENALAGVLRPNMLGTSQQTTSLIRGLCELAHTLDEIDVPIDYLRRQSLAAHDFLPWPHWEALCESLSRDPGAARRHRNARRYLWHRLTALDVTRFPDEPQYRSSRAAAAEYTDFRTRMTIELQTALDSYARAYLQHQGLDEPVTWSPWALVALPWPGPEILDLDLSRLHALLGDGVLAHGLLARELGVSVRRVVRALDEAPPSDPRETKAVDWAPMFLSSVTP